MKLRANAARWAFGALLAVAAAAPAVAQDKYTADPVTLVTLSSPGGGTDVFLREVIRHLGPIMGKTFIVVNTTGGGGAKAMAQVGQSAKDGSMLLGTTGTLINTTVTSKVQYGSKDMDWVVNFFLDPSIVYVRAESPFKTLQDIVDYAKANPGKLKYGLATPTSQDRYAVERLKKITGANIVAVPFDGGGELLLSVLNGTLDVANGEPQELAAQLAAGKIRILATLTDERVSVFPDVKTAKEQGIDLSVIKFRGLSAPKGTPPAVKAAWADAAKKLLADPAFKAWYEKSGLIPAVMNAEEYERFIAEFYATQEGFFREIGVLK